MNQKQALSLPEAPLRQRLADVRDIYTERNNANLGTRLSMAEGGCFLPPPVEVLKGFIDAAANLGKFPHQIYPQNTALPEFIDAIHDYFTQHCGIPLNDEEDGIVFGFGSSYIFDMLLSVICAPGDVVLMPESYYHSFAEWPEKWQAHAYRICTSLDNGYKLTAADLDAWFKSNPSLAHKAKCLVLTSPTTTGAVYSREELESLSEIINRHGLYLYCDEVFRDTVFSGKPVISAASIPGLKNRTITSTSGSKSRSVADLRIGWACGPKDVVDRMIWHMEHSVTEIPLYLQAVGTRIIRDIDDTFLQDAANEYQQRVFMIALVFADAENGVVLIDELENALHTTLLLDFSRFLHELAIAFRVQVFVTSHSKECIDAFVTNGFRLDEMSTFTLVQRSGQTVSIRRSGAELAELLEIGDVDMRRAR